MERRRFLQNTALGLGSLLVIPNVSMLASPNPINQTLVPLGSAMPQIRHGLLNLPQMDFDGNLRAINKMPFDWLGEIRRNLFFKNGFQASEANDDIEIVSMMYHDVHTDVKEAIQIQLSETETTLLMGEAFYTCPKKYGIYEILQGEKGNLSLYYGQIKEQTVLERSFGKATELFIHLLEGRAKINGADLSADYGIAMNKANIVEFEASQDCQLLIFEHKLEV